MTILDSYAVIAYLKGEQASAEVATILRTDDVKLTAFGVAEAIDHLVRIAGVDEESAALDLAELGLLDAISVDAVTGLAAGRLRARHYHRIRCAVSVADCVTVETARAESGRLATSDPHLLNVCHSEGVGYLVLSGSSGSRWTPPR